ncbi:unnamed protein product [Chrysoparadoxa australica]
MRSTIRLLGYAFFFAVIRAGHLSARPSTPTLLTTDGGSSAVPGELRATGLEDMVSHEVKADVPAFVNPMAITAVAVEGPVKSCFDAEATLQYTGSVQSVNLRMVEDFAGATGATDMELGEFSPVGGIVTWPVPCGNEYLEETYSLEATDAADATAVGRSTPFEVTGIQVLSPNATDDWWVYLSQEIVWEPIAEVERVNITLHRDGIDKSWHIVSGVSYEMPGGGVDAGTHFWFPLESFSEADLASGLNHTDYYVQVQSETEEGLDLKGRSASFAINDAPFTPPPASDPVVIGMVVLLLAASLAFCSVFALLVSYWFFSKGRQRRRRYRGSMMQLDSQYVINGEGHAAILALDAQPIALAHAERCPDDKEIPGLIDLARHRPATSGDTAATSEEDGIPADCHAIPVEIVQVFTARIESVAGLQPHHWGRLPTSKLHRSLR